MYRGVLLEMFHPITKLFEKSELTVFFAFMQSLLQDKLSSYSDSEITSAL